MDETVYTCDFCGFEGDRHSVKILKISISDEVNSLNPDGPECLKVYSKKLCSECIGKLIVGIREVVRVHDPEVRRRVERSEAVNSGK